MNRFTLIIISLLFCASVSYAKNIDMSLDQFQKQFVVEMKKASSSKYSVSKLLFKKNNQQSDDNQSIYIAEVSSAVALIAKQNNATKKLDSVAVMHSVEDSANEVVMWSRFSLANTLDADIKNNADKREQRLWTMHSGRARKEGGRNKVINGLSYSYFQFPGTDYMIYAVESH